jgi:hypothetical protein
MPRPGARRSRRAARDLDAASHVYRLLAEFDIALDAIEAAMCVTRVQVATMTLRFTTDFGVQLSHIGRPE